MADYTKLLDHYLYDLSEDVDLIAEAIATLENLFDHRNRQELMYFSRPTAVSYLALKKAQKLLKEHEELKSRHKILVDECDKMYYTLKEKNKTIEELEDDLATTKDMLNHYLNGNE